MTQLHLPLPASELPTSIRRFGDPAAPAPARTMAARGLVPVKGADLVTLLVQLSRDPDEAVSAAATKTLTEMPPGMLHGACANPMHPAIIHELAELFRGRDEVLEPLVMNADSHAATIASVAAHCSELIAEAIAVNQQRALAAPAIIEALYKNPNTRMSTVDRLVELCARNGVALEGIPAFQAHAEALVGQLIPEPCDEPLPGDMIFQEALAADADEAAIESDEDKESVKARFLPLRAQIDNMQVQEKLRLAVIGSAAARSILLRDPHKMVSQAAITSPRMTAAEAAAAAHSREVGEDILRYIGARKKWLGNYEVKRALIFNPKTPVGISLTFLAHLRDNDLRTLTRSRGIPGALKQAASQRQAHKNRGRKQ